MLKLPASGYRHYSDGDFDAGYNGYYWTSTVPAPDLNGAQKSKGLSAVSYGGDIQPHYRALGMAVRCIEALPEEQ